MPTTSRLRESAATLVAIGAVLAITSALAAGAAVFLDHEGTRGIQTGLATRAGADLALRASLNRASNPDAQDEQVRAAIAASFAPAAVDVEVTRALDSHVTIRAVSDDPEVVDRGGSAQSIPDFADRVDLVSGAVAEKPNEVAVQADAAAALGLAPGGQVLIAGERFVVTGTWRVKDFLDPRWYGDEMLVTGYEDDFGPFVIPESAWSRLDVNPTVTWTIVPDAAQIDASNIALITGAWSGVRDDWRREVDGTETLSTQNRLVLTLRELQVRLDGLRAVEPVIFTLTAAVALVGLAELIRLLAAGRRSITALYWARGDSRRSIARRLTVDVAAAAAVGTVVGLGATTGGFVLAGLGGSVLRSGFAAWVTTLIVVAGAVVLSILASRPAPASAPKGGRAARRARQLALPGVAVLAVLAAAVSVSQLRLYGSPLTPTVDGSGSVDPIAVVAPAAALAAAVLLLVLVLPRLARLVERRAGSDRLTVSLATRNVARRLGLMMAPLVLMALATGSVSLAATYSATWETAFGDTAALRAGSDLHVDSRVEGIPADAQDEVRSAEGVSAVAPLEVQPLTVGGESGTIVGASPGAVAELAVSVPGQFDPAEAAAQIRSEVPGPVLPADATGLSLTVAATGFVSAPELSVYLADEAGFLRHVPLVGGAVGGGEISYAADALPAAASGAWRIAAIDFRFADQRFEKIPANLRVTGITALTGTGTADIPIEGYWIVDTPGLQVSLPVNYATGAGFVLAEDTSGARLTPSLNGTYEDRVRPPVVVSQQLASRFDIGVGDTLAFSLRDGVERLNGVVAAVVPAIPGARTDTAVLMDLAVIQHFQLRTTAEPADPRDLWISTSSSDEVATAIQAALPANTRIDSRLDPVGRQILGSATVALGATAAAIVLLAVIGVGSSAAARLRGGRNDVAVLRALGLSAREQGRILAAELWIVLAGGLVAGLLAGAAVAVLTIPYFARAAVTLPYLSIPTQVRVDLVGGGILLGVLCLGAALVVLTVRARVGRLVAGALPGGDAE